MQWDSALRSRVTCPQASSYNNGLVYSGKAHLVIKMVPIFWIQTFSNTAIIKIPIYMHNEMLYMYCGYH